MTHTWTPGKIMAEGRGGMVAAQHEAAARAGVAVLEAGGNAMDAAVTATLVLSVVEPWLSGIGGGGFLLWRDGTGGSAEALDFSVRSAMGITAADYPLVPGKDGDWFDWPQVEGQRNLIGVHAICVPGTVAGLAEALARHGTIPWAQALAPAIAEADAGLEVDWFTKLCLSIDAANLAADPASAALFLRGGRAPAIGTEAAPNRLPMARKADTLRRLAEAGPEDFYTGQIARDLVADMAELGGPITLGDLAAYRPRWLAPLRGQWAGAEILAIPGLSGGPTLLDVLGRMPAASGTGPDARFHAGVADAIRAAYATRLSSLGHAAGVGSVTDPGCTTHVSVIDAAGNAVSLTNTLLSRFGAKVTSRRTGMLLNNGMMWFDPRPGQPNSIAPGVQPLANMCPLLVEMADGGTLALGAAGGRQIMPALVQILAQRLLFGRDPGQALSAPRLDASTPRITLDRRLPADTAGLVAHSHDVIVVDDVLYPVQFAIPNLIERSPDGGLQGMVHPNHPWSAALPAARRAP